MGPTNQSAEREGGAGWTRISLDEVRAVHLSGPDVSDRIADLHYVLREGLYLWLAQSLEGVTPQMLRIYVTTRAREPRNESPMDLLERRRQALGNQMASSWGVRQAGAVFLAAYRSMATACGTGLKASVGLRAFAHGVRTIRSIQEFDGKLACQHAYALAQMWLDGEVEILSCGTCRVVQAYSAMWPVRSYCGGCPMRRKPASTAPKPPAEGEGAPQGSADETDEHDSCDH